MKKYLLFLIFIVPFLVSNAQTGQGALKLTVTEKGNQLPIPFANVIILRTDSSFVSGGQTDFNGQADIRPIPPGKYIVKLVSVGFQPKVISGVVIQPDRSTILPNSSTEMTVAVNVLDAVVIEYKQPLIRKDAACTSTTIGASEIRRMPQRIAPSIRSSKRKLNKHSVTTASPKPNIRGARTDASLYYIDGIKTREEHKFSVRNKRKINAPVGAPKESSVFSMQNENYELYSENDFVSARDFKLSTFSIDVDQASYTNARRIIEDGYVPPMASVRTEEFINYFPYERFEEDTEHPFGAHTELGVCPWNEKHQLLKVTLQANEVSKEAIPRSNLVFLIDVSGSMQSPDKIELLKRAFRLLTEQLQEDDLISIVTYAGSSGVVLEAAKGKEKERILASIDQLTAGGSTNGSQGIITAYDIAVKHFIKRGNNRVILATDGDFNVGVSSQDGLIKLIEEKRNSDVFLTTLGFGTGNYQDAKMEQLADHGNGSYMYIDSYTEARKVFLKELTGNLIAVAKDVKFQIEFNPSKVGAYRLLGYENRMLEDKDFDDDTKDAGELGAGQTVTAFYELIPVSAMLDEDPAKTNLIQKRYQKTQLSDAASSNELLFIKMRYKQPDLDTSTLITKAVASELSTKDQLSEDFVFASSVVEFCLILRNSAYKGQSSFESILKRAKESIAFDPDGHRREFITLVEMTEEMYSKEAL